jgi:hypothetical protein
MAIKKMQRKEIGGQPARIHKYKINICKIGRPEQSWLDQQEPEDIISPTKHHDKLSL